MIALRDISFSYEGLPALEKINLSIDKGEAVSLMGTSGCGKSTLLRLINGIISADSGSYHFNGEEITKQKLSEPLFGKSFHKQVGFVFQNADVQLFCATVFDEIAFGPRQMGMSEKEVSERVGDCLSLLGIDALSQRQPYHLSGGEKRKTAIASVLALNPDVLTLDEPLTGLDPKTQRWFVDLIVKLNQSGKTVITSTHNLELVQELSCRTILFNQAHCIAADMPTVKLLEDSALLRSVNLVDDCYHKHEGQAHSHFHSHPL